MGSSTTKAQRLANEANIQIAQETNQANRDIAAAQNDLNYKMFNEQNAWNREQWNLENEYNSPSAQMRRYMEAGINPLWAMSKGDAGQAAHLESAQAAPAVGASMVGAHVEPEYDPTRLNNIVAAAQNLNNSLQGFYKLGLESIDVDTRKNVADSTIALNRAESLYKKSQTTGQDIFNNLNTATFQTLVQSKVSELNKLNAEISNTESATKLNQALIDNARATKDQIIAQTNYVNRQAAALIDQVAQGWTRLRLDQQIADTETFVAHSNSYYQGENLKLQNRQFELQKGKTEQELNNMSTSQVLEWYKSQRGWLDQLTGSLGAGIIGSFPGTDSHMINECFRNMKLAGTVLSNRINSDPSVSNVKSYQEYLDSINDLPSAPSLPPAGNAVNPSVLNPVYPSSPWNE